MGRRSAAQGDAHLADDRRTPASPAIREHREAFASSELGGEGLAGADGQRRSVRDRGELVTLDCLATSRAHRPEATRGQSAT